MAYACRSCLSANHWSESAALTYVSLVCGRYETRGAPSFPWSRGGVAVVPHRLAQPSQWKDVAISSRPSPTSYPSRLYILTPSATHLLISLPFLSYRSCKNGMELTALAYYAF
ncbi:hypothetical protein GW17_00003971 [Ensete ventricosum]|nr:hypothetical protein GW17_00003971 [Ensete ventricosum]